MDRQKWSHSGSREGRRQGLYRAAYFTHIENIRGASGACIALVPNYDTDEELEERVHREASLLDELGRLDLPFGIPKRAFVATVSGRAILVREALWGRVPDRVFIRDSGFDIAGTIGHLAR